MKKVLIHGEYMCILNLIALPFLVMFFNRGNMMFWVLLLFLDIAEYLLLLDEKELFSYVKDKQLHHETLRIKIYMIGIVIFYIGIACLQSLGLLFILIANDALSSAANFLLHKHVFHKDDGQV